MSKPPSKSYEPAAHERRIFAMWEAAGCFRAEPDDRPREQRFCMVIPPPNVTGALHLGHALNNTLQDVLVRRKRMAGCNTFWLVGTDHAGIATQAVVEKTIRQEEGKNRYQLGPTPEASRAELVRRIWEWKEKFGGRIVEQLKMMGCSCDYSRERFTLDDGCARAVRETFFKMFRDGLIYRGKRLVNWDTQLQTAVADDEVYHEQVKGHFYHFRYPIVGQVSSPGSGEPAFVLIATTRPETMLGDTAVAVHPDPAAALGRAEQLLRARLAEVSEKERPEISARIDEIAQRRESLLPTLLKMRDMARAGRKVLLPLVNREIPLICDEWADPTLGTGCVKITPAHDANDYQVGQRHGLEMRNVMTPDGRVNENGGPYQGLKFAEARKRVVEDLQKLGLVEKIEDRLIDLGHSDRSKAPIEPYLSDQWFVKMGDLTKEEFARVQTPELRPYIERAASVSPPQAANRASEPRPQTEPRMYPGLAQMAIDAVTGGLVEFHPARYAKTYIDWLSEKRDWCISRQLWWGHRIPVWIKQMWTMRPGQSSSVDPSLNRAGPFTPGHADKLCKELGSNLSVPFAASPDIFDVFPDATITPAEIERRFLVGLPICLNGEPTPADEQLLDEYGFKRDEDVLDTWFSSALWPHSTLGWPDGQTEPRPSGSGFSEANANPLADARGSDQSLLAYYYPTDVLSTAREIITLWVARMILTGLYNMGQVPFRDVYIHPLIQDGQGRKMSKSAGNGVDPADIIEEYGADALRFTLAELTTETQDIRLPVKPKKLPDGRTINVSEKFEKGRNFCNKLWQAATGFVIPNLVAYEPRPLDATKLPMEDRWILSRLTACQRALDEALSGFRFSEAVGLLYRFMWDEYCAWYIELVKPRLGPSTPAPQSSPIEEAGGSRSPQLATWEGEGGAPSPPPVFTNEEQVEIDRTAAQQVLVFVLDRLLRMLHPITPFVTEAIWQELSTAAPRRGIAKLEPAEPLLATAGWPQRDLSWSDEAIEHEMALVQQVIAAVRDLRTSVNAHLARLKKPAMRALPNVIVRGDAPGCAAIQQRAAWVSRLGGATELKIVSGAPKPTGSLSRTCGKVQVLAPVSDLLDLREVRRAEAQKLASLREAWAREQSRLENRDFTSRADPGVVAQAQGRLSELSSQIRMVEEELQEME